MGYHKKYIFTPEIDTQIRETYQKAVYMPAFHKTAPVKRLAAKFKIPRWKISRRAGELGVRMITKKESDWTDSEKKILERQAYKHPEVIQRHLKKAGFHRSVQAIVLKRKRTHLLQSLGFETAHSLALCLGIDEHAVIKYIKKGWLKAKKRGTKRTHRQGGDHWLIKLTDIHRFIIENVSILDFRKIDKFWLVDLLAGGHIGLGPIKSISSEQIDQTQIQIQSDVNVDVQVLEIFNEAQLLSGHSE